MRSKITTIFWGLVLILIGGLLLADRLGAIDFDVLRLQTWTLIFAGVSILFLASYFLTGVKQWGWLFPAFIFGALALTLWMIDNHMGDAVLGAPILAAVALPFWIGYALDRKNWGLLIPAWILTALTLITVFVDIARGEWIGALVLFAVGLPFLVVYLRDRSKRWALIPAWILSILAVVTLLSAFVRGEWIGALVLFAIGLPFLVVYLFDRSKRWALIPAWVLFILAIVTLISMFTQGELIGALVMYAIGVPFLVVFLLNRSRKWALIPAAVMGVLGTIPLMVAIFGGGDAIGAAVMFLFALPFFVVYFWSPRNWWALIPAGIFASIGLIVVLANIIPWRYERNNPILTGILLLGFGVTFGVLWLRRATVPTDWAKFPAIGLLVAGIVAFFLGENLYDYWAYGLMAVGLVLIVTALLPKRAPKLEEPTSKEKPKK